MIRYYHLKPHVDVCWIKLWNKLWLTDTKLTTLSTWTAWNNKTRVKHIERTNISWRKGIILHFCTKLCNRKSKRGSLSCHLLVWIVNGWFFKTRLSLVDRVRKAILILLRCRMSISLINIHLKYKFRHSITKMKGLAQQLKELSIKASLSKDLWEWISCLNQREWIKVTILMFNKHFRQLIGLKKKSLLGLLMDTEWVMATSLP